MELGFVGLGRMGLLIVEHLVEQGVRVVVFNRSPESLKQAESFGAEAAASMTDVALKLSSPRMVWIMVTAGKPVDVVLDDLLPTLSEGDMVIDGGNSDYKDSKLRFELCKEKGIHFLDIGTSGGLEGAQHGACLTVGGERSAYDQVEPLLQKIAAPDGYLYVGEAGAGHYVKTIHNGMEYALLQAYGEGLDVIKHAPYDVNLHALVRTWNHGSVIRSWLLELLEKALKKDPSLERIEGYVGGGETGRWAIEQAESVQVNVDSIKLALKKREESQDHPIFSSKVVAALRAQFGGHEEKK
ncbi:MAG: decarboxylating 6-phosphogluconate dehydrogenase [bacterium]|nr:decarboxylating 6-phosphogluconate dehydrogenase [bacterium]